MPHSKQPHRGGQPSSQPELPWEKRLRSWFSEWGCESISKTRVMGARESRTRHPSLELPKEADGGMRDASSAKSCHCSNPCQTSRVLEERARNLNPSHRTRWHILQRDESPMSLCMDDAMSSARSSRRHARLENAPSPEARVTQDARAQEHRVIIGSSCISWCRHFGCSDEAVKTQHHGTRQ